jgi:hypothetical protein
MAIGGKYPYKIYYPHKQEGEVALLHYTNYYINYYLPRHDKSTSKT